MTVWQNYNLGFSNTSEWITDSPSMKAKKYLNTVFEWGFFQTKHPYFTERCGLNKYLIVFTIKGNGYLKYQNHIYSLKPGSFFVIHCVDYQKYWTAKYNHWDFLWMHVSGVNVDSFYNLLQEEKSLVIHGLPIPIFENIFKSIPQLLNKHQFYLELEVSQRIEQLLIEAVKNALHQNKHTHLPEDIKKILGILQQEFKEKITLDQLSKRINKNKYQMSKEFKKHVGLSPNEYLIIQRINAAKYKLRETNDKISTIAESVGVVDTSHFIELFKKREGITPAKYRELMSR